MSGQDTLYLFKSLIQGSEDILPWSEFRSHRGQMQHGNMGPWIESSKKNKDTEVKPGKLEYRVIDNMISTMILTIMP